MQWEFFDVYNAVSGYNEGDQRKTSEVRDNIGLYKTKVWKRNLNCK